MLDDTIRYDTSQAVNIYFLLFVHFFVEFVNWRAREGV